MTRKIKKVVVANRGEIAVRIFRTLKKMGIAGVALYSDADADSFHVRCAAEAMKLEGNGLSETYLNIHQIVHLAIQAGADAIHPGYGFLSESPAFSAAVRMAGMAFIGPGDEAIRLMGNKVEARIMAEQLGIPVIKGATGVPTELHAQAVQMGFPVLVKAAAGGGGKGMRIVAMEGELQEVLETTQRESFSYFGNGEVYIEKYLTNPRHIEVQLMADQHGNTVCLFERECSIQRRYQKIIEEAPSPSVTPMLRQQLMDAAKNIATSIGYENAGTIEFLVTDNMFYFLEMNTRIQVEHPVTEMITGLDIVEMQLHIAMGMPLPFRQESLKIKGHAIEARVYAEDPINDFRPSPGTITYYREPLGSGVRVDSAIDGPEEISREFDPMISKVIVHAHGRDQARTLLVDALEKYAIHGINTNAAFLRAILHSDAFSNGDTDTGFCNRFSFRGMKMHEHDTEGLLPIIAAFFIVGSQCAYSSHTKSATNNFKDDGRLRPSNLWRHLGYWRLMMNPHLFINDRLVQAQIISNASHEMVLSSKDGSVTFRTIRHENNYLELESDGTRHSIYFSFDKNGHAWIQYLGNNHIVRFKDQINEDEANAKSHHVGINGSGSVKAPMHGKVIKIHVKEEDVVNKGDTLIILESMKMENRIVAPGRARVQQIKVSAGDVVASDTSLVFLSEVI